MKRAKLRPRERRVLRELDRVRRTSGPWIATSGLAERLELPVRDVEDVLAELLERGLVDANDWQTGRGAMNDVRVSELGQNAIA